MESRKKIFIVDDDEDDQLFLYEAVNDLDIPVDFFYANNGEMALRYLKEEHIPLPDFIFLDLNMPKLNGKECLTEIKKMPRYAQIPVIIYTTSSHQKDIQEIMELGASCFLTKPTRIGDLGHKLLDIFSTDWQAAVK
jgi:CheY-like chemotaxis protein